MWVFQVDFQMAVGERKRSWGQQVDGVKWDLHSAGDPQKWGILFIRVAEILVVLVACGC